MKKPFILRRLDKDIYFSPEDFKQPTSEPVVLKKGEKTPIGKVELTFIGFEMGQHAGSENSMRVAAKIQATVEGTTRELAPAKIHGMTADGKSTVTSLADTLIVADHKFPVEIASILADQGAVQIAIPGLIDSLMTETLVIDVSTKPLINLVWVGAIIILLGTTLSLWRRGREMSQVDQATKSDVAHYPVTTKG